MLPCFKQLIQVHVGHLDGLESINDERRSLLAELEEILHRNDRPDSTGEQFFVFLHRVGFHFNAGGPQVEEVGFVHIALFIQLYRYLVYYAQVALFAD